MSSALAPDVLMSTLIEMGFAEAQASAYSQAYGTLEAALEALLRDEAAQGGPPMPVPGAAAPAPAAATHDQQPPGSIEEHKEPEVALLSGPTEWRPLRNNMLSGEDELELEGEGPVDLTGDSTTNEIALFEVLQSGLAIQGHTALREWSVQTLSETFQAAAAASSASPSVHMNDEPAAPVATTPMTYAGACIAGVAATNETDSACVFCLDATKNTMLLPCRHLCLCSSCALEFFGRVRSHNHLVSLLKASAAEEARTSRFISSLQKTVAWTTACPECAVAAHTAVRRRVMMEP